MPIPRVAIVGRPNVGKSSLLNMLAGAKVSIVDDQPGVTRDRVSAIVDLTGPEGQDAPVKPVEFIDTGGFGVYTAEGQRFDDAGEDLARLTGSIEAQIGLAIASADVVLFAVDAQAGVTPQDLEIARMLREGRFQERAGLGRGARGDAPASKKSSKTTKKTTKKAPKKGSSVPPGGATGPAGGPLIRVVATKVDGQRWEPHAQELAGLGFGEPLMCSAKINYMRRDLGERLYELLPEPTGEAPETQADLKLAIVGKRNAGKSSLVNYLAGQERVIVSEIAGTTRDSIDVRFERDGRSFLAIDTAGLRRRKSFSGRVEWFAYDRLQRSVARADVVLFLVDATSPVSQVDEQVAMLAQEAFKPVVIVVNKWDLAAGAKDQRGRPATPERYEEYLRKALAGLTFAPIAFVSASTGQNVWAMIDLAFELREQARARVTTGVLNRMVQKIVERRGPPSKLGTPAKVYYAAQRTVDPPTITLVVNFPKLFTPNYRRFLENRFREELPFAEVPIRIEVRGRKRLDEGAGGPERVRVTKRGRGGRGPVEVDLGGGVTPTPDGLLPEAPDAFDEIDAEAAKYFDDE